MWSAITSAITRDLSEFASVVSSDAAQLLHTAGEGSLSSVVTGDEDFPEASPGLSSRLTVADVRELQTNIDTYRVPLSPEETIEFQRWVQRERAMDPERWRRLLTESGEIQEAYEVCVDGDEPCCADDEFFGRYFWRLYQLRGLRAAQDADARAAQRRRFQAAGASRHEDGGVLAGWDDDDTSLASLTPACESGTRVVNNKADVLAALEEENRCLTRRVAELEALVTSLTSQLQTAGVAVSSQPTGSSISLLPLPEVEALSACADSEPHQLSLMSSSSVAVAASPIHVATTTAAATTASAVACISNGIANDDDDDDWTKLT